MRGWRCINEIAKGLSEITGFHSEIPPSIYLWTFKTHVNLWAKVEINRVEWAMAGATALSQGLALARDEK